MQETLAGSETNADADSPRGALARVIKPILLLSGLVVLVLLTRSAGDHLPLLAQWVKGLGAFGPIAFILIYALAAVLFIPGVILTLAGGALFGLALGTVYVFLGAIVGSGAAFLASRYLARGWIETKIADSRRFAAVDAAVAKNGLKITFLLRLSPVFPFNFLNYALGLTRVSFRDYMIAGFGMLPATVLYVYYGRVIGDVAQLASGTGGEKNAGDYAITALGLIATLAVTAVVTRIARKALDEAQAGEQPSD
jgi:uncharacterized membrane protein YdjX (TVP38/TMEM64 family)